MAEEKRRRSSIIVTRHMRITDHLSNASGWSALRSFFQGCGNSGYLAVRQYRAGGDTVLDNPFTSTYRPLNVHDHSNYKGLCGMAERQGIANGYIFKSRHTDYNMRKPKVGGYLATEGISFPEVPGNIIGTVAEQIAIMQGYFQAMINKDHGTYDYRNHFKWALAVEEVWPELYSSEITDTFESDRHTVDAKKLQEQMWKHGRDGYGGIMGRGENINDWSLTPFITSELGEPQYAVIKNRVTAQVVGDFGQYHPSDIFEKRPDTYGERRAGTDNPPIHNRYLRHRVVHNAGSKDAKYRSTPGILDEMMGQCYGLQGGGTLDETYWDKTTNSDFTINKFGTTTPLNAAKFSRFVGITLPNASGRRDRRRGFNDSNFFAALTDNERVIGVSDGVHTHRYSWGLPLELVMLNPLMSWNPHGIPRKGDPTEGRTRDGRTPETAFSGYRERNFHYLTPDAFYNGSDPVDPADTRTARWMLDSMGVPQLCRSSGPWIVLPPIANVSERVRGRFIIHEDAIQSPAMAQALDLRD